MRKRGGERGVRGRRDIPKGNVLRCCLVPAAAASAGCPPSISPLLLLDPVCVYVFIDVRARK